MRIRILLSLAIALVAAAGVPAFADAPREGQVVSCNDLAVATPMAKGSSPHGFWLNILDGDAVIGNAEACSCSGTCGLFETCACTSCTGCSTSDCQACCNQGCKENCEAQ